MIVYAIQWRDETEPWGWESWLTFSDEAVALSVYEQAVEVTLARADGPRSLAWAERHVENGLRLVSMPVLSRPLTDVNDPMAGDSPPGIVVLRPLSH